MRSPRVFTDAEIAAIEALARKRVPWSEIGTRLRASYEQVRKAVDKDYAERKRAKINEWRNAHHKPIGNPMVASRAPEIPNIVLIERERAMQLEQSITAICFGDPLPGRSALDMKRRGIAP